ncbi:hypothetical protein EVAR_103174_1 [Eumeta japonica]|uniref:Uncharacterized protein n=1 Tax=Eumeta variegata TaxID=151549 RepID=A0A4C1YJL6_EUMVA|nr:hypothetical protein EVAR_103174_1 [Eumeta japonica]
MHTRVEPLTKTRLLWTECCFLKSLLDPEKNNPEIDVTKLAEALHTYSESQKIKEHDESFNVKDGSIPQDSDSGISTDGFQMLEDLQCELREKAHLANKLRNQLDFTDLQHEEMVATLTAERNALRTHNNMLKEENLSLTHVRRDYDDVCERLCSSEAALDDARKELEIIRKQNKTQQEQIESLQAEKFILQELLAKSKAECHKINEMYATRQAALIEQNETLKTDFADVSARLQDQEEFMQQIIKEKVLVEMELKDLVNKSNQSNSKLDRSIDVSYTEDQMISTLEGISPETKFSQDHQLDEDVFMNTFKDEACPSANMSLFDEIRLSFGSFKKKENERCPKDSLKSLFQIFAVLCFCASIVFLYGATRARGGHCAGVPARWLAAREFLDAVLRVQYVGEVPM